MEDPAGGSLAEVKRELGDLLAGLAEQLQGERAEETLAFFARIAAAIEAAREPDDLAGPFLELSTAAFRGFRLSAPTTLLVDAVLERAQRIAFTLSADGEASH